MTSSRTCEPSLSAVTPLWLNTSCCRFRARKMAAENLA